MNPAVLKMICLLLAVASGAVVVRAVAADASALADPTRPPPGYLSSRPDAEPTGGAAKPGTSLGAVAPVSVSAQPPGQAGSAASAPRAAPAARLSLVRLAAQGGVSSAVIDGRAVGLGDRVGDATVASIDEQGVVLRSARGWQRLLLAPAVGKTAPTFTTTALRPASAQPQGGKDTQ